MIDTPEFSHIVRLSEIGSAARAGKLTASEEERQKLAQRFDLPRINSLEASYTLEADGERIGFAGLLESDLLQCCAITGEDFEVQLRENFDISFIPKREIDEEEIELTEEDCDIVEFENAQLDLGEAIAQSLYLALDPFPRGPDADAVARKKGLQSEEEAGPFGALAALKDKLG